MTQDEIIEMARRALEQEPREDWNSYAWVFGDETLKAFAKLVAEHEQDRIFKRAEIAAELAIEHAIELEREACAKICEEFPDLGYVDKKLTDDYHSHLIRQRGQE